MVTIMGILSCDASHGSLAMNWRGKIEGSRSNLLRGGCLWFEDYLSRNPIYHSGLFRRRFRISLKLFRLLERELPLREPLLRTRKDAKGVPGHKPWQKILSSLRGLATGRSFDDLDDHSRMSAESSRQYFFIFLRAMVTTFGDRYLNRHPSTEELETISALFQCGLPWLHWMCRLYENQVEKLSESSKGTVP